MPRRAPKMPQKLTEAAFELFSKHGFENVTIDEIAAKAGVTKGSFYSHFAGKRDIILAACSYYYRQYLRKAQEAASTVVDPLEKLRDVIRFSVRECVVNPSNRIFTTEILNLSSRDETVRKSWAQFYDAVREMYVGMLMTAKKAGKLPVDDPRLAVDMMLAAMEGIKLRAGFEEYIADEEEQTKLADALFNICTGRALAVAKP